MGSQSYSDTAVSDLGSCDMSSNFAAPYPAADTMMSGPMTETMMSHYGVDTVMPHPSTTLSPTDTMMSNPTNDAMSGPSMQHHTVMSHSDTTVSFLTASTSMRESDTMMSHTEPYSTMMPQFYHNPVSQPPAAETMTPQTPNFDTVMSVPSQTLPQGHDLLSTAVAHTIGLPSDPDSYPPPLVHPPENPYPPMFAFPDDIPYPLHKASKVGLHHPRPPLPSPYGVGGFASPQDVHVQQRPQKKPGMRNPKRRTSYKKRFSSLLHSGYDGTSDLDTSDYSPGPYASIMDLPDEPIVLEVDPSQRPRSLQEAINMYIDFLIWENDKKVQIDPERIIPMPCEFHREDYYVEAMSKPTPFPTVKLRSWLKLYNVDIEITDPEGNVMAETTFAPVLPTSQSAAVPPAAPPVQAPPQYDETAASAATRYVMHWHVNDQQRASAPSDVGHIPCGKKPKSNPSPRYSSPAMSSHQPRPVFERQDGKHNHPQSEQVAWIDSKQVCPRNDGRAASGAIMMPQIRHSPMIPGCTPMSTAPCSCGVMGIQPPGQSYVALSSSTAQIMPPCCYTQSCSAGVADRVSRCVANAPATRATRAHRPDSRRSVDKGTVHPVSDATPINSASNQALIGQPDVVYPTISASCAPAERPADAEVITVYPGDYTGRRHREVTVVVSPKSSLKKSLRPDKPTLTPTPTMQESKNVFILKKKVNRGCQTEKSFTVAVSRMKAGHKGQVRGYTMQAVPGTAAASSTSKRAFPKPLCSSTPSKKPENAAKEPETLEYTSNRSIKLDDRAQEKVAKDADETREGANRTCKEANSRESLLKLQDFSTKKQDADKSNVGKRVVDVDDINQIQIVPEQPKDLSIRIECCDETGENDKPGTREISVKKCESIENLKKVGDNSEQTKHLTRSESANRFITMVTLPEMPTKTRASLPPSDQIKSEADPKPDTMPVIQVTDDNNSKGETETRKRPTTRLTSIDSPPKKTRRSLRFRNGTPSN